MKYIIYRVGIPIAVMGFIGMFIGWSILSPYTNESIGLLISIVFAMIAIWVSIAATSIDALGAISLGYIRACVNHDNTQSYGYIMYILCILYILYI